MVSQRKVRACVRACVATSCGVLRMALVRDRGFDPATAEHLRTSSSGSSSGSVAVAVAVAVAAAVAVR